MAPKKRPETQKTSEIVLRPRNKRSRSPRELEPEAKKLCAKGSGTACACCLNISAFRGARAGGCSGGWVLRGSRGRRRSRMPPAVHSTCRFFDTRAFRLHHLSRQVTGSRQAP